MVDVAEDIRNGDRKAFEMFYRLEFNNLVHFIASYTSDRERAMDLAQDVLISSCSITALYPVSRLTGHILMRKPENSSPVLTR